MVFPTRLREVARVSAKLTITKRLSDEERASGNIKFHSGTSDLDDCVPKTLYEMTGSVCNISKIPINNLFVHLSLLLSDQTMAFRGRLRKLTRFCITQN
jgi:hypothetical protein